MKRDQGFKLNKTMVLLLILAQISSLLPGMAKAATPAEPLSQVNSVQNEEELQSSENFAPRRGASVNNSTPVSNSGSDFQLMESSVMSAPTQAITPIKEKPSVTITVPTNAVQPEVLQNQVTNEQLKIIEKWLNYKVILGMPDGQFYPERLITRAEVATILLELFGYIETGTNQLTDISPRAWYADAVNKVVKAKIFVGDNFGDFRPDMAITKQEMLIILARAFDIELNPDADFTTFTDANEIPGWSKAEVGGLLSAGYDLNAQNGILGVTEPVNRAEFVMFLNNMAQLLYNVPGEYTGEVQGNVLINSAGVQLKNVKITGDLFLTQGIGTGDVVLEDVIVQGAPSFAAAETIRLSFAIRVCRKCLLLNKDECRV